jgi:PIN domain nuclease of toxin-antitoxin system
VILLDTSAIVWIDGNHRRVRRLLGGHQRLCVSPASLLELQFLVEVGRIDLGGRTVAALADDDRWVVDDPPAAAWFERTWGLGWTRDPFDRLLVAHAQLRRWRLATADAHLLDRLSDRDRLAL